MPDPDDLDAVGNWTIKDVGTRTRRIVTKAAQRENMKTGQWLDRHFTAWDANGSPVRVVAVPDPPNAGTTRAGPAGTSFERDVIALGALAGMIAAGGKVPVDAMKQTARAVASYTTGYRPAPESRPRSPKADAPAIAAPTKRIGAK